MAQAMLDQMEFTLLQSQNRTEQEQKQLDEEAQDLEALLKTFKSKTKISKIKIPLRIITSFQKK